MAATSANRPPTLEAVKRIKSIRNMGIAIILVEHDMKVIMGVSDKITVLSYGRKIAEGLPHEIRQNPQSLRPTWGANPAA